MSDNKKNPKTKHEKKLHQNTTDEKGAQKQEHYNQYGKTTEDRKERGSKKRES